MNRRFGTLVVRLMVVSIVVLLMTTSCEGLFDATDTDDDNDSETENEPEADNTTKETAADLNLATNVQATLTSGDEEHWYVFDTANQNEFDVIRAAVTNAGSDLRVRIHVTDIDGNTVFTHPSSAGDPGANQRSDFSTPGGRYYVCIDSYWSTTGAYTLNVQNLSVNDQYAGNDAREQAHNLGALPVNSLELLLVGASERDGGIEEDWFKFTTENDGKVDQVRFEVTDVGTGLRPRMRLLREDGSEVFVYPSTAPNAGASIAYNLGTRGGTYYLRIDNHWTTYGPYTLSIENRGLIDDYELNDTRAEAYDLGELPLSSSIDATIAAGTSNGDADWFTFTLPTGNGSPFTVSVTDPADTLRVALRVEDEPGNSHSWDAVDKGVDSSLGTSAMTYISPDAGGRYYVRVTGLYSNDWGAYTLAIAQ